MSHAPPAPYRESRAASVPRRIGVSIIVFAVLARVMSAASRVPYWDLDPMFSSGAETTRTPAMSLMFDGLVWLAAGLIVWAEGRAGRRIAWGTGALVLIGSIGCLLHGYMLVPIVSFGNESPVGGDFASLSLGSTWSSAMVGAWALSMAARDAAMRRAVAAVLMGVVVMLAAKGALQVFVEHPRLVADFEKNRETLLAAQGFEPGSTSALLFERRLRQPEATGWFGLANVYGSFAAAGIVFYISLALSAQRAARERLISSGEAGALWLAAIAAGAALWLSGSKGAVGAALLGFGCLLALWLVGGPGGIRTGWNPVPPMTRKWLKRCLMLAPLLLPVLVLALVVMRGVIGERVGELSLYFRWQYLVGAARIIAEHQVFGVGPAGFKDAYLLAKVPTSPEEVESPHSLLFDWGATLGVFGAVWAVVFVIWLHRAGQSHFQVPGSTSPQDHSAALATHRSRLDRSVLVFPAVFFSWWCARAEMLPDALLVQLIAALAWWLVGGIVRKVDAADPSALTRALFVSIAVLASHCMIEVTGVMPGTAAWVFASMALLGASRGDRAAGTHWWTIAVCVCLVIGSTFALIRSRIEFQREDRLQAAAEAARSAIDVSTGAVDPELVRRAAALLPADIYLPVASAERDQLEFLASILEAQSGDLSGLEELAERRKLIDKPHLMHRPRSSTDWARLAQMLEAAAPVLDEKSLLTDAARAWEKVAELDPHGQTPPRRLAQLYAVIGDSERAGKWARRALDVDENLRLDPLKRLTDEARAEMHRLAAAWQNP